LKTGPTNAGVNLALHLFAATHAVSVARHFVDVIVNIYTSNSPERGVHESVKQSLELLKG
jgi:hypothetical protein